MEVPGLGTFTVLPSRRPYEFTLANPQLADIRIWNPDKWPTSAQTGQFFVSFRSVFMQLAGTDAALAFIEAVEAALCAPSGPGSSLGIVAEDFTYVSRADLAVDVVERRALTKDDLERFTCKSRKNRDNANPFPGSVAEALNAVRHEADRLDPPLDNKGGANDVGEVANSRAPRASAAHLAGVALDSFAAALQRKAEDEEAAFVTETVSGGRALQTAYFGCFGSPLYARKYDKLASLAVQDKLYMLDVWRDNGWQGERHVWRTEFSVSNEFLKNAAITGNARDLRDLGIFLAAIPDLWHYLTHDWLRFCVRSKDTNVTRWNTAPLWKIVQAGWPEGTYGIERIHDPRPSEEQVVVQAEGCLVTALALIESRQEASGAPVVDEDTGEVPDATLTLLNRVYNTLISEEYRAKVEQRRKKLGVDSFSDAVFTALARQERIAEGLGS